MHLKITALCFAALLLAGSGLAGKKVLDASRAKPSDVAQAERFLNSLPDACSGSYAHANSDGAVVIRLICIGNSVAKSTDGTIIIKDGKTTQIE
ncbi:MAG: hypothetical protein EOL98_10565 [Negativicutes bacterium]|nr:hypothetical protein [Negativicutes bacterium]